MSAFVFDNDVVLPYDEAQKYGLRVMANVIFADEPLFEVDVFLNDVAGDYFDPLFALVLNGEDAKLYHSHWLGADYSLLAVYDMFTDDFANIKQRLLDYQESEKMSDEGFAELKSLFNVCVGFIKSKIELLRK
jgi:hypothetical protein